MVGLSGKDMYGALEAPGIEYQYIVDFGYEADSKVYKDYVELRNARVQEGATYLSIKEIFNEENLEAAAHFYLGEDMFLDFLDYKTYGMADIKESNYIDTIHLYNEPVPHIKFAPFEKSSFVSQCFSTRLGGVSSGMFKSMNLTFNKVGSYEADLRDNVMENFRRMGKVINTPVEDMVYSKQTHTNNVLYVDDSNRGMGIVKDRNYDNIDGLVTGTKELTLVTSFADCIPVVMADEKSRCIASVHAGWRGTVSNIVKNAINMMTDKFGSNPCDIIAFIGPGICVDCYEEIGRASCRERV